MSGAEADGFLARWSQRKTLARQEGEAALPPEPVRTPAMPAPVQVPDPVPVPQDESAPTEQQAAAEPPPTLADVARLTPASDFSRFVAQGVEPEVKNAALKTLFSDPHFNVMDGLDTYIDDYSKPDPLPASMLKKMAQARFLGLFTEDDPDAPTSPPDEDPDLRLQPHDAAGREGPEPGAGGDTRREP